MNNSLHYKFMYWRLLFHYAYTVFTAKVPSSGSKPLILQVKLNCYCTRGTIGSNGSKINITPKGVYLPNSKLHSILAVANLLAHNNISQICYCGQISLPSAVDNCSFPWQFDTFGCNIYFAGDGTYNR